MRFYASLHSFAPSLARGGLALYLLGWVLAGCAVLSQPTRQYEEAKVPVPQARQYRARGAELLRQKKYAEAEATLREAIRLNPRSVWSLALLASSMIKQARYAEAEMVAREALRLDATFGPAHMELGTALSKQPGKDAEAEAAFRNAIRLGLSPPENLATGYARLGAHIANKHKFPEAETYYRKAIRINPNIGEWYGALARTLEYQDKYAEAEVVLRKGLQIAQAPHKDAMKYALERVERRRQAEKQSGSSEVPRTLSEERAELERERQRLEEERERLAQEREQVERRKRERAEAKRQHPSEQRLKSQGSGFLLKDSAFVLTVAHVVDTDGAIAVQFPDGSVSDAALVIKDTRNDLALIRLESRSPSAAGFEINPLAAVLPGQRVYTLGYPLGSQLSRQPSVVGGIVSSAGGVGDEPTRFRMTAPLNPGNSGGPVINEEGELVGIAVASGRPDVVESISLGIKIGTVLPMLNQMKYKIAPGPERVPSVTPAELFERYSPFVVLIVSR